jgi:hypothetical protein
MKTKETLSAEEQIEQDLKRETLARAVKELLAAPQETTALAEIRPRDGLGRYTPKTKLTKSQRSQKTMQKVLALKDATGKTLEERVATHLLKTAEAVDQDGLIAGAKALETILARAHGKVPESAESLAAMQRDAVNIVFISQPELMHNELTRYEDQPRKPLKPSFADAELVSENPPTNFDR